MNDLDACEWGHQRRGKMEEGEKPLESSQAIAKLLLPACNGFFQWLVTFRYMCNEGVYGSQLGAPEIVFSGTKDRQLVDACLCLTSSKKIGPRPHLLPNSPFEVQSFDLYHANAPRI